MGPIANAQQNFSNNGGVIPTYNQPVANYNQPSGGLPMVNLGAVAQAAQQAVANGLTNVANTANADNSAMNSGNATNSELAQAIGQSADNTINQSNNMIGILNGANNTSINDINGGYGTQKNILDQQLGAAQSNLQQGQNKLNTSAANSFRDLVNQMRGSMSGYANMLGNQGAGNSSATNLINYALQQQGNQNLGDLNQQVAQQQTDLAGATKGVKDAYDAQLGVLDSSHVKALHDLSNYYAQTMASLEAAKQNAGTYKAQMLATYGQQQLAQQALTNLANLNASYNDKIANLKNSYKDIAPVNTAGINYTQSPQGVNANQFNLGSYAGTQVAPQQITSPVGIFRNNNNTLTY